MYRLLQGDVGSGKTLVAAEAAIIAIENGYQVAVLAPTEILAAQHYFYFKKLFQKLGYVTILLTGSSTAREKTAAQEAGRGGPGAGRRRDACAARSRCGIRKLGLAMVDEQHRFGVEQRQKLLEKGGQHPDVLVMTATPIPRTLALTIYGDLDVSVIDEMPPGRKPIVTKHVRGCARRTGLQFREKADRSRAQAYVVYPVIEESRNAGHEGRAEDARASVARRLSGRGGGLAARQACRRTKKNRRWRNSSAARPRFWCRRP